MKIGNPKKTTSPLKKIFKSLPETFDLVDVKKALPKEVPKDPYSLVSLVDVLEHVKNVKRKTRSLTKVVYEKIK